MKANSTIGRYALIFLTIILLASCRLSSEKEGWWMPSPANQHLEMNWLQVSSRDVYIPRLAGDTIPLLSKDSFIRIDQGLLRKVMGFEVKIPEGKQAFLLRGLTYSVVAGHFQVFRKEGEVAVENDSLGKHEVPMQRWPIVVMLDSAPRKIYVSCAMDE